MNDDYARRLAARLGEDCRVETVDHELCPVMDLGGDAEGNQYDLEISGAGRGGKTVSLHLWRHPQPRIVLSLPGVQRGDIRGIADGLGELIHPGGMKNGHRKTEKSSRRTAGAGTVLRVEIRKTRR